MRSLISRRPLVGVLALLAFSLISWGCDGSGENDDDRGSRPIPLSFTDNNNGTITDNITSLMWQKEDDEESYTWAEAVGSTEVGVCEGLELGGFSDWRVPSVQELLTIVVYERVNPAIDTTYFPDVRSADYWTSTEFFDSQAYRVEFRYGASRVISREYRCFVRCVRGNVFPSSSFTDNADGTVTDNITDHMWQQATSPSLSLGDGKQYCTNLTLGGYGDWRMPTIRELTTLLDYTAYNPRIDTAYFPDTIPSDYLTTTITPPTNYSPWCVDFFWGTAANGGFGPALIRCVRDQQQNLVRISR